MSRFSLITHFGTILYLDTASGALRHGDLATAPRNVVATRRAGWIDLHGPGDGAGVLRSFEAGALAESHALTLGSAGLFASADRSGGFSTDRARIGAWEKFLPLTAAQLDLLDLLTSRAWVLTGAREALLPAGAFRIAPGFLLQWEEQQVSFDLGLRDLTVLEAGSADGHPIVYSMTLLTTRMALLGLSLFRPLVYWCIFGQQEIFDCFNTSLTSLREFGRYGGEIAVISDRDEAAIRAAAPRKMLGGEAGSGIGQPRFHAAHPTGKIGYTFERYNILERGWQAFQPILYLDSDVVIDRNINGLLVAMAQSRRLWISSENDRPAVRSDAPVQGHPGGDWYGQWLYRSDQRPGQPSAEFLNSGVLGFPNIPAVTPLLSLMRRWRDEYPAVDAAKIGRFCDQPFLNYALQRGRLIDFESLNPYLLFDGTYGFDVAKRRGFLHFQGGVGSAQRKTVPMAAYMRQLRALRAKALAS